MVLSIAFSKKAKSTWSDREQKRADEAGKIAQFNKEASILLEELAQDEEEDLELRRRILNVLHLRF